MFHRRVYRGARAACNLHGRMNRDPMPNPNISVPAALIGEPTRAAILMALCDGRAHTAGALADALGISAQSASNHLGRLIDGELLSVVRQGRHRYYRLASTLVAQSIEALVSIAALLRPELLHRSRAPEAMCLARCCYSHLAGALGVKMLEALLAKGVLVPAENTATGRTLYVLNDTGARWASRAGFRLTRGNANPRYAISCLDWTERKNHLAGLLGTQIFDSLIEGQYLEAATEGRALRVTPRGAAMLQSEFGIDLREPMRRSA
jgi:DNA-binding transcriptional ArsR family regulator